jgi:cyclopropane fatty-acyl-phospholipid synthase-like methyltransferase
MSNYRLTYLVIFALFILSCEPGKVTDVTPPVTSRSSNTNNSLSPEQITGSVEKGRDSWQKPMLILNKMGNLEGKSVADIGAYYGYFTFLLAYKDAQVIAVDIDPGKLDFIQKVAENESNPAFKENISYRLVKPENPDLKSAEVDHVLFVNMLEYLDGDDYRKAYLSKLKDGLKSGGQINIVDFKMKRLPENLETAKENRVYPDVVEELLYDLGFTDIHVDDTTLDFQYIITARKP